MNKRKSYKIVSGAKSGAYSIISPQKIADSNKRINAAMESANRVFQKKQKVSVEKAAKIVLNA